MAAPMVDIQNNRFAVPSLLISVFYFAFTILIGGLCQQSTQRDGFLLCRKCGHEIGRASDLFQLATPNSMRTRNDTIGQDQTVYIQLLKNPHGVMFEVVTTSKADVERADDKYSAHSWFPGFVWSLIFCPRCSSHMGWWFEAIPDDVQALPFKVTSFVGLIFQRIIHEAEESLLIAEPKSFMS